MKLKAILAREHTNLPQCVQPPPPLRKRAQYTGENKRNHAAINDGDLSLAVMTNTVVIKGPVLVTTTSVKFRLRELILVSDHF